MAREVFNFPFLEAGSHFFYSHGVIMSYGILNSEYSNSSGSNCRISLAVHSFGNNSWRIASSCAGNEQLDSSCSYDTNSNSLFCFGGRDAKAYTISSEMWKLSMSKGSWEKLEHAPKPLYLHGMIRFENEIFDFNSSRRRDIYQNVQFLVQQNVLRLNVSMNDRRVHSVQILTRGDYLP
jgi:hypothetical protein